MVKFKFLVVQSNVACARSESICSSVNQQRTWNINYWVLNFLMKMNLVQVRRRNYFEGVPIQLELYLLCRLHSRHLNARFNISPDAFDIDTLGSLPADFVIGEFFEFGIGALLTDALWRRGSHRLKWTHS